MESGPSPCLRLLEFEKSFVEKLQHYASFSNSKTALNELTRSLRHLSSKCKCTFLRFFWGKFFFSQSVAPSAKRRALRLEGHLYQACVPLWALARFAVLSVRNPPCSVACVCWRLAGNVGACL